MNQIKWKVCGLRDNIVEVAALQPDYIGFIFYRIYILCKISKVCW